MKEGVTAVLVDVVVRDKRGQPVRDLTEADFELSEDGVAQKIGSFTPIQGPPAAPKTATAAAPAPAAAAPPGPANQAEAGPAVTAIVFHGLDLENRKRAVQAAQSYLGDKEEMQNYVGIFGIDLSLRPLVPFTRNGLAVRQALNRMATGSTPGFNSPEMQQQREAASAAATSATNAANSATAGAGAGNSGAVGTAAGDARLAEMSASIAVRLPGNRAQSVRVHRCRRAGRDCADARPAARTQERHPPFRRADDHDAVGSGCFMESSTPPTAPTSASTPSTPQACAR